MSTYLCNPLPQGALPATTQRPLRDPGRGPGQRLRALRRRARRHPLHPRGTHRLKRQHGALQAPGTSDPRRPPPPPLRQGQGPRPRIPRRHNGRLPWTAMSGAIPRRWPTDRQPNPRGRVTRFDATDRRPVDKWTAAPRPTTSPQGQQQQKRSTHMVHKPANSDCSRHMVHADDGSIDDSGRRVKSRTMPRWPVPARLHRSVPAPPPPVRRRVRRRASAMPLPSSIRGVP